MKAAIDIGSNTVLLLVAKMESDRIVSVHEEQRIPRLARGVDTSGSLDPERIHAAISDITHFQQVLHDQYPEVDQVIVTATSAVRDASNGDVFVRNIHEQTGWEVRILTGPEEAEWTFSGALSTVEYPSGIDHSFVVIDIGGGSTEIAIGTQNRLHQYHSFDMGCVRFTERYLLNNPPTKEQIETCQLEIKKTLSQTSFQVTHPQAVGVAGTLTSLGALKNNLTTYLASSVEGVVITRAELTEMIRTYSTYTHQEILERSPAILKGRNDLIFSGMLILDGIMENLNLGEVRISTGGIRHGALLMS